jgi:general nucleoside transport system permease protein
MGILSGNTLVARLVQVAIPILLSVVLTGLLMLLLGADPFAVYQTLWDGAFRDMNTTAAVFNFWIPLALASAGLVVTFTAGLWNIGVEGQIVMGAIFASWGARTLDMPQPLLIPLLLILAGTGGALWAIVVGFLKTRLGIHEIFGGVAANAIANNLAIYLIAGPWQPPEGGSAQATAPFPEVSWLPLWSEDFPVSALMLLLTLLASALVMVLLTYTRYGLELKATGRNPRSAFLLGVPTERAAWSALAFCGLLAGLAGAHRVLHTYHSLRPLVSGGIGFLALLVVLLVGFRAVLVPFVAFIAAALFAGSARVKVLLKLDQSLVGVLQGMVVLLLLFFNGLRERYRRTRGETRHE